MREIDELRPLTAGRLLELWRSCRESSEDPLEQTLLCNGRILAACCFGEGEPVFPDGEAALASLTGWQMEALLRRIAGEAAAPAAPEPVNPAFDPDRFRQLKGE